MPAAKKSLSSIEGILPYVELSKSYSKGHQIHRGLQTECPAATHSNIGLHKQEKLSPDHRQDARTTPQSSATRPVPSQRKHKQYPRLAPNVIEPSDRTLQNSFPTPS